MVWLAINQGGREPVWFGSCSFFIIIIKSKTIFVNPNVVKSKVFLALYIGQTKNYNCSHYRTARSVRVLGLYRRICCFVFVLCLLYVESFAWNCITLINFYFLLIIPATCFHFPQKYTGLAFAFPCHPCHASHPANLLIIPCEWHENCHKTLA